MGFSRIDINLLEAWQRVGEQCRADPALAMRRARRRLRRTLASPPRAWCLCIRAADSRMNTANTLFDFPSWYDLPEDDPRPEDDFIKHDETWQSALARGIAHSITLSGPLIRELTKPVTIDWPGKPLTEVADILGRNVRSLYHWIDRDSAYPYNMPVKSKSLASGRAPALKRKHAPPLTQGVLKLWGYDYPAVHGKKGMPIPIVYTPSPIDPNYDAGRPASALWGTLWQGLWKNIPEDFEQTLDREMHWRTFRGKPVQRGWRWICPGRIGANGQHVGCGRICRVLYVPMPIWTLGRATGEPLALDLPEDSGLAGQWHPGEHEPAIGEGQRTFACKACWNVRNMSLTSDAGWNEFVSYISGGLLYGRDVPRPTDEAPLRRLQRYAPHPRGCPKNEAVLRELIAGRTITQIAARMNMTYMAAWRNVWRARRKHGVKTTEELVKKLRTERKAANIGGQSANTA